MKGLYKMLGPGGLADYEAGFENGFMRANPATEAANHYLVPGFVDIHIHGGFGIDFMAATPAQMVELADRLEECGYDTFFPTTVSASAADVLKAADALPDDPRMPGFHLEGPFISPKFPGAQPPEAILEPPSGKSEWDAVFDHPKLRIVTLAPEIPGGLELAERLNDRGVVVSMGHTDATFAEARRASSRGARHTTHTFNAMRPFHHREAGVVGYALTDGLLYAELIYDRHHVAYEPAALLFRCKREGGIIAVSDGTMASGMPSGKSFEMWGKKVAVKDGKVTLGRTQTLAGSAATLLDCFRNLAEDFGPETAIRCCCQNPRMAMAMSAEPRVWAEFDSEFNLVQIHRPSGSNRSAGMEEDAFVQRLSA